MKTQDEDVDQRRMNLAVRSWILKFTLCYSQTRGQPMLVAVCRLPLDLYWRASLQLPDPLEYAELSQVPADLTAPFLLEAHALLYHIFLKYAQAC